MVTDLDGTFMRKDMVGDTPSEIAAATSVRSYFEKGTFMVATAQTAEMPMSEAAYRASVELGFDRPPPLLKKVDGRYAYVAPESIPCRKPFTDPDVIMSIGTGSHVRLPNGGYFEEPTSKKLLGGDGWRPATLKLFEITGEGVGIDILKYRAPIEYEELYYRGETNVFPLKFRIQLEFADPNLTPEQNADLNTRVKMHTFLVMEEIKRYPNIKSISNAEIEGILMEVGDVLGNLHIGDESRPPQNHFQSYYTPEGATKRAMADVQLARLAGDNLIERLFLAGDMPPDLDMGCNSGRGLAKFSAFSLAGGSPLVANLWRGSNTFGMPYGDVDLGWIRDHLVPTGRDGFELFKEDGYPDRLIVVGDIAYPNRVGPETLDALLRDETIPQLLN